MSGDLQGVELAMALEEALGSGDKRVAALKPYLLDAPVEAAMALRAFVGAASRV